jgi:outer membrane protein
MKKTIIALVATFTMALGANAQKFGHVDVQAIMQSLPEVTKANGELQAQAQQYDNDLKAMQEEIQRKAEEYEKNKATMSATQQQQTEADLQAMYQKMQEAYQQNQQEMQKKQQELLEPIQKKVVTAIENVGKAGNYTHIAQTGAFLYMGSDVKDVTADVKAELNKLK